MAKKAAKRDDREFIRGVAWAVATLYEQHDASVQCTDLILTANLTLNECRRSKVDPYDMKSLRKLFRSEPRLIRRSQSDASFCKTKPCLPESPCQHQHECYGSPQSDARAEPKQSTYGLCSRCGRPLLHGHINACLGRDAFSESAK